jgi:hypothetical protein
MAKWKQDKSDFFYKNCEISYRGGWNRGFVASFTTINSFNSPGIEYKAGLHFLPVFAVTDDELNLALGTLIKLIDSHIEPLENGMVRYINDKGKDNV